MTTHVLSLLLNKTLWGRYSQLIPETEGSFWDEVPAPNLRRRKVLQAPGVLERLRKSQRMPHTLYADGGYPTPTDLVVSRQMGSERFACSFELSHLEFHKLAYHISMANAIRLPTSLSSPIGRNVPREKSSIASRRCETCLMEVIGSDAF